MWFSLAKNSYCILHVNCFNYWMTSQINKICLLLYQKKICWITTTASQQIFYSKTFYFNFHVRFLVVYWDCTAYLLWQCKFLRIARVLHRKVKHRYSSDQHLHKKLYSKKIHITFLAISWYSIQVYKNICKMSLDTNISIKYLDSTW